MTVIVTHGSAILPRPSVATGTGSHIHKKLALPTFVGYHKKVFFGRVLYADRP
jgi:hypothetical protein